MDIDEARKDKEELQLKIARLLEDFEKETNLSVDNIKLVRRSICGFLGIEESFQYVIGVEILL